MYCWSCGKQIDDAATYCPYCGKQQKPDNRNANAAPLPAAEETTVGWTVLGFFFPIVGLILFLVWMDDKPLRSKACGKGALIGVIVEIVVALLTVMLVYVAIFASMAMWA